MFVICRHCSRPCRTLKSRGLCWVCHADLTIRNQYPLPHKGCRKEGDGDFCGGYDYPAQGTSALPGSDEKIAELERRVADKVRTDHPHDNGARRQLCTKHP